MISDKATQLIEEMLKEAEDNCSATLIGWHSWDKGYDKLNSLKDYIAELEITARRSGGGTGMFGYEVYRDGIIQFYGVLSCEDAKLLAQNEKVCWPDGIVELVKVSCGVSGRETVPFMVNDIETNNG